MTEMGSKSVVPFGIGNPVYYTVNTHMGGCMLNAVCHLGYAVPYGDDLPEITTIIGKAGYLLKYPSISVGLRN